MKYLVGQVFLLVGADACRDGKRPQQEETDRAGSELV